MAELEEKMLGARRSVDQASDVGDDITRFQKGRQTLAMDAAKEAASVTGPLDIAIEGGKKLYKEYTGKDAPGSDEASTLGAVLGVPRKLAQLGTAGAYGAAATFGRGVGRIFSEDVAQGITDRAMRYQRRPLDPSDYLSGSPEMHYLRTNPEKAQKMWELGVISTKMLNFLNPAVAKAPATPTKDTSAS